MRPQPPGQAEHCAYLLPYVHVPGVSVGKGTKARIGLQIRAWACNLGVLVGHSPYPAHLARARAGRPSTCETHGRAEFATRVKRCAITARAHRAAGAPACTSRLLLAALSACVWQASGAGHQGTRRSVHAPRDIRHDGRFRLILRGVAFLSASAVPPLQRPPLAAAIHDHQPLLSTLAAPALLLLAAAAAPRPSESTRSAVAAAARAGSPRLGHCRRAAAVAPRHSCSAGRQRRAHPRSSAGVPCWPVMAPTRPASPPPCGVGLLASARG